MTPQRLEGFTRRMAAARRRMSKSYMRRLPHTSRRRSHPRPRPAARSPGAAQQKLARRDPLRCATRARQAGEREREGASLPREGDNGSVAGRMRQIWREHYTLAEVGQSTTQGLNAARSSSQGTATPR
ncbi:hypothetical protein E2C01_026672 [Portunus trituberculatus]|uniref:Uncharacterized protein n=1 Tax=Portunus trituberculatus TaxID=210409 RepID=A0A5B7EIY8_PORTR|nr:hypothetical protein [Portunus trituberculatus]